MSAASAEQAQIDARLRYELDIAVGAGTQPQYGPGQPAAPGAVSAPVPDGPAGGRYVARHAPLGGGHAAAAAAGPATAAPDGGRAPGHGQHVAAHQTHTTGTWPPAGVSNVTFQHAAGSAWHGMTQVGGAPPSAHHHHPGDEQVAFPTIGRFGGLSAAPTAPTAPTACDAHHIRGGRGRRRHRSSSSSASPPRRRRRRDRSSSSENTDDEDMVDRRNEHRLAALRSRAGAAHADLRLPSVTAKTARRLKNRRHYVAVEDAVDKVEQAPSTVMEYVGRVANILTHTAYHFPQCGLQVMSYLAWLINRSAGRSLRDVQTADSRARQAMALRPRDFLTSLDLDQFMPVATGVSKQATGGQPSRQNQICFQHTRRNGCTTPCRTGRIHPPCARCNSTQHATVFHDAGQYPGGVDRPDAPKYNNEPPRRGPGLRR